MDITAQIERLKERLQQPLPGLNAQNRMAARVREMPAIIPGDAKLSAVLALLFPQNDELYLLLIKRVDDGKAHGGQISFPGGRKDTSDIDLKATALRETYEEVGIPANEVAILGALTPLYIPVSYNQVQPFVGFAETKPEYTLSINEVQYVLEVPLNNFFEPNRKIVTQITPAAFPHITLTAPAYQWEDDHLVWGATAMIISELEELIS